MHRLSHTFYQVPGEMGSVQEARACPQPRPWWVTAPQQGTVCSIWRRGVDEHALCAYHTLRQNPNQSS